MPGAERSGWSESFLKIVLAKAAYAYETPCMTTNEIEKAFFKKFGSNGEAATAKDWTEYHTAVMPAAAFAGAPKAKAKSIGWVGAEGVNHRRS